MSEPSSTVNVVPLVCRVINESLTEVFTELTVVGVPVKTKFPVIVTSTAVKTGCTPICVILGCDDVVINPLT